MSDKLDTVASRARDAQAARARSEQEVRDLEAQTKRARLELDRAEASTASSQWELELHRAARRPNTLAWRGKQWVACMSVHAAVSREFVTTCYAENIPRQHRGRVAMRSSPSGDCVCVGFAYIECMTCKTTCELTVPPDGRKWRGAKIWASCGCRVLIERPRFASETVCRERTCAAHKHLSLKTYMDEEHADALMETVAASASWFAIVDKKVDVEKSAEATLVHMAGADLWKYFV